MMVHIIRGPKDEAVTALAEALAQYEQANPGAEIAIYRQGPASIRIRIIDRRFEGMSRSRRHDAIWEFLASRVHDDVMSEVSLLLPFPPHELQASLINAEFDHPVNS